MTSLYEKYRPASWTEIVGQDRAIGQILGLKQRGGLGGRAFFLSGKSGTGKSSIAKLIANEIAGPFFVEQHNGADLCAEDVRHIERTMNIYGADQSGKSGRCWIIEEAHGLSKSIITRMLVLLENLPKHVCIVFTTTCDGMSIFDGGIDANPLLSRCIEIALSQRDLAKGFAARAKEIAEMEGLDGQPIEKYIRMVNDCGANFRMVLQKIESGMMLCPK